MAMANYIINIYKEKVVDGIPCGYGILTCANGEIYKGDFQNGVLQGQGELLYPNGNIYVDNLINEMPQMVTA